MIVQHEYGIYGGRTATRCSRCSPRSSHPTIVVLHTVLDPDDAQRRVLERVAAEASAVVVMTETARRLLASDTASTWTKVSVIPHGVPEWIARRRSRRRPHARC